MEINYLLIIIVGLFVSATAAYLGSLMVTKKMALVSGPLSHLAFPGVAIALTYNFGIFWGALASITLGAIFVWLLKLKTNISMEVLTGIVFTVGLSLGLIFLPIKKAETAFVGDITKINYFDALISIFFGFLIIFFINKIYSKMVLADISEEIAKTENINIKKCNLIYLSAIALTIAMEVKIIGALLPIALSTIPAATSKNISNSLKQYSFLSVVFGVSSFVISLALFKWLSIPLGPLMILIGGSFFLLSLFYKNSN